MKCPKEIFAEIYRLNLLLGPQCKSGEAKTAFEKHEKALHELRLAIENETKMLLCEVRYEARVDECKVSDE